MDGYIDGTQATSRRGHISGSCDLVVGIALRRVFTHVKKPSRKMIGAKCIAAATAVGLDAVLCTHTHTCQRKIKESTREKESKRASERETAKDRERERERERRARAHTHTHVHTHTCAHTENASQCASKQIR